MQQPHAENPDKELSSETSAGRTETIRFRWYHFYFLLATFDVIIIMASLGLYHQTLSSYKVALRELSTVDAEQRWLAALRMGIVELNAPGNDVFESRDVARQRKRARRTHENLLLLYGDEAEYGITLEDLRKHVDRMTAEQEKIFDLIEKANQAGSSGPDVKRPLEEASVLMAAMDRHQADALGVLAAMENTLLTQQDRLHRQYYNKLEQSAMIEKYAMGAVILILVGVFWYGRKLQQAHEQMIANQERVVLERQERLAAIGGVCSAVAHGIRNPLAAIMSSAQLALLDPELDENAEARFQDVLTSSKNLDRRVTRLLDFSRGSNREVERFAIEDVISQVVHDLQPQLDERGVEVIQEFNGEKMTTCGDRERFAQSIIELVSNSMHHLPEGGRVRITTERHPSRPDCALIGVIDNGPGIPENIRSQVFDLFFTSRPGGGGIGLASVKRAIELHNGEVKVLPSNGRGTHIEITLPLARD